MSGCNNNQNYGVVRSTSRVLNPPGGKSTFSLGGDSYEPPPRQNQGRRAQESQRDEYEPRRSPRHRPAPAPAADFTCSIPGLQDHYRTLAQKNGTDGGGVHSIAGKAPRDRDYDRNSRDAASSMRAQVRHAEEDSSRRRDPSPFEAESGRRGRGKAEQSAESGPSVGELALLEARRQAVARSDSDRAGGGIARRSDKAPAAAPVAAASRRNPPPRDAYENVLSSDTSRRGGGGRDSSVERDSPMSGNNKKAKSDGGVKLIGGMDRRGPAIPPGGNSTFSLGWN